MGRGLSIGTYLKWIGVYDRVGIGTYPKGIGGVSYGARGLSHKGRAYL